MDIAFIEALNNIGFPLAFLVVSLGALKIIAPIIKNFLDTMELLFNRLVDIQDEQKELLRLQSVLIHTIEQRITRIEREVGKD